MSVSDLEGETIHLPVAIARNETRVRRSFWPKLAKVLSRIPFAEDAIAAYYCAFDPGTPLRAKAILLGALAYFILPFDILPDAIVGLGFTDDLTVLLTAISMIRTHLRPDHRDRAKAALERLRQGERPSA